MSIFLWSGALPKHFGYPAVFIFGGKNRRFFSHFGRGHTPWLHTRGVQRGRRKPWEGTLGPCHVVRVPTIAHRLHRAQAKIEFLPNF